jgi:Flp pilus assembly protein TadG
MRPKASAQAHREQRGQTIGLFAISIAVLIVMAALAIDLTTLYVARSQMQRTADAAALAGAKALVDSGVTTDPANANLQTLAQSTATNYINAVLTQNKVEGVAPNLVGTPTPTFTITYPGNQRITVTVQSTNLPLFFARIWVIGKSSATVTASATAEAYNSTNSGGAPDNQMPPVAPTCIKPWLVPNIDHLHGDNTFVNSNGSLTHPGIFGKTPNGVIGETFTLENLWESLALTPPFTLPSTLPTEAYAYYLPAIVVSASGACASCSGSNNYDKSIFCCNTGQVYACGGTTVAKIDLTNSQKTATIADTACLIGSLTGTGQQLGRDRIDFFGPPANYPSTPIEITQGSGPHSGFVNTSSQIVTLPIIDKTLIDATNGKAKVIGFMQAFVDSIDGGDAGVKIHILNISGCGTNINTASTVAPILGGGVSPVPVRLIHP